MTSETSSEQQFVPLHDAHAIEQVLMVLQMAQPMDAESFKKVRKASEQFSGEDGLPGKSEIQRLVVAFGQDPSIAGQMPQAEIHGLMLSRTAPNGVIETELRIEPASITFRTTTYSRWQSIWDQANRYFQALAELYAEKNAISAISLNYVDKFVWSGDPAQCSPKQILKAQSPYIAPHVYGQSDLWHSHTGAFLRVDAQTKRLLNVNIDFLHEEPIAGSRKIIGISTVLTDMFNQPGYDSLALAPADASAFVANRMKSLHDYSKLVFADVISEDMGKRVALNSKS
jgi:uncharacterized protein (TIGR04255 family)